MHWIHDRRFVLRNLRDLGMGKTYLEQAIHVEAQAIVDDIKSLGEKPINPPRSLRTAVLNIIWQMVAGKRYDLRSKEVDRIFNIVEDFREQSFLIFFANFFPVFNILPTTIMNRFLRTDVLVNFSKEMNNIIMVCTVWTHWHFCMWFLWCYTPYLNKYGKPWSWALFLILVCSSIFFIKTQECVSVAFGCWICRQNISFNTEMTFCYIRN